jgi:heavy metal sensor kinase
VSPRARTLGLRARLTLWYGGVLLAILLVFGVLSYAALRWTLQRDVDSTLLVVAQVVRDTGYPRGSALADPEARLRALLGADFFDRFLQLLDPEGASDPEAPAAGSRVLPLSVEARVNARRGLPTFETVQTEPGEPVRVLTMPVVRNGRLANLIQVGIPLRRTQEALNQYLRTLLALIPIGLGLATAGGALVARRALSPVGAMSRTARRITAADLTERIPARGAGDELDHLAETLNAMLIRLEAAFAQVRRFAADAAHELRTPLTALRGELEVGLRADRSPDEYRRVLQSVLESVERLVRLAEDLLVLSRASSGGLVRSGPVDLEALVLGALDAGARLAQGRGVTVRLGAVEPAGVTGDAVALERALLNLVDNAVRYTPSGGKVEISAVSASGWVEISVQDSGPGIALADVERVFDPFVRLEAARARETEGTGLGLAIARSVVTVHGGSLTVQSTLGAGSRFTIRLPRS